MTISTKMLQTKDLKSFLDINVPMLDNMKRKIQAIEYLRLLKSDYTYEKLSKKTGLPATVLNRYIVGRVLPSQERA